ncbi:hypothetical protein [Vreelandella jeotgali]|uniref:hypothetical protein n=1 Tax=Vreelandella jeotgali TaxID=553386 RepID=UPI000367E620|nr:hypothetical protein [Halomonas jeotgali]
MQNDRDLLSLYDVVYVIVPRLHRAQKLVNQTVESLIDNAPSADALATRLEQRRQFTLEVQSIHANLEHLLERYRKDVQTLLQSGGHQGDSRIAPDEMETEALEGAREIYRKVVAFQTGRRDVPF